MWLRVRLGVAGLGLAVSLAGCNADIADPARLQGETWRLLAFQRPDGSSVALPRATFTVQFGDDGRLSARADCNSCGGTYEAADGGLRISALACTRVFCSTAPVDTDFVTAVQEARTFEVADRLLTLRGRALLVFER